MIYDARSRDGMAISPLLTPKDLAHRWGVSEGYLAQRRFKGDSVPYVKLGPKKVAYLLETVEEWERGQQITRTDQQVPA